MIPYQKERLDNAVSFIASKYREKTHKYLSSMFLYKLIALFEFARIKESGQPPLGLTYLAMECGPVPMELYENRASLDNESFKFISKGKFVKNGKECEAFDVVAKNKADLDFFSEYEIDELYRIIDIYADSSVKTDHAIEASHKDIYAWKKVYNIEKRHNAEIKYTDEFHGDVKNKKYEQRTLAEENALLYESRCMSE
jgi:hypothetical protein